MYLDFNFQSEEIVIFKGNIRRIFKHTSSKIRSDSCLEYSIDTFWLCDNESADDLWDILIKHPILKLKHEKYCLFSKKIENGLFLEQIC